MEMSGQLHVPAALLPGNPSLIPIEWAQSPFGPFRQKENIVTFLRIEPRSFGRPAPCLVTTSTLLYLLLCFYQSAYSAVNKIITAASADNTVETRRQRRMSAVKCRIFGT